MDIKHLLNKLESYKKNNKVLVGVPKGSGKEESGESIASIAFRNEFGVGVPERPALRLGVEKSTQSIKQLAKVMIPKLNNGDITMEQIMDQVGHLAVQDVINLINAGISPANAQSTIDAKGSSTPLVDTGAYKQSITHVVDK